MSPRQKVNCSVSTDIVYNPSPVSSLSDSFRNRDYNINSIQIVEKKFFLVWCTVRATRWHRFLRKIGAMERISGE